MPELPAPEQRSPIHEQHVLPANGHPGAVLGRTAVEAQLNYLQIVDTPEGSRVEQPELDPNDPHAAFFRDNPDTRTQAQKELEMEGSVMYSVAYKLNRITENDKKFVGRELTKEEVPPFILRSFGAKDTTELVDRLAEVNIYIPEDKARLMNFLQWHNQSVVKQEKEYLATGLPERLDQTGERMEQAVRDGHISPVMAERLKHYQENPDLLSVVRYDIFAPYDTPASADVAQTHGGRARVTIYASGMEADVNERVVTHELTHLTEGRANREQRAAETPDRALEPEDRPMHTVFGRAAKILREGTVEHTADSLVHGNFEVMDPYAKERENSGSYRQYRKLLHVLSTAGEEQIPFVEFTDAIVADDLEVVQAFADKLERVFPNIRIVERISNLDPENKGEVLALAAEIETERKGPISGLDPNLADLPSFEDGQEQFTQEGKREIGEAFQTGDEELAQSGYKKIHGPNAELPDDLKRMLGAIKQRPANETDRFEVDNPNTVAITEAREEHEQWIEAELEKRVQQLGRELTDQEVSEFAVEAGRRLHDKIAPYYSKYN